MKKFDIMSILQDNSSWLPPNAFDFLVIGFDYVCSPRQDPACGSSLIPKEKAIGYSHNSHAITAPEGVSCMPCRLELYLEGCVVG